MARPKNAIITRVEREFGRPIGDILIDGIERTGSVSAFARELGVDVQTIYQWIRRSGLHLKMRLTHDAPEEPR